MQHNGHLLLHCASAVVQRAIGAFRDRSRLRYTAAMVDEPDIERLARTFLDLWQEQVAASASDTGLAGLFAGGKAEDQAGDHANSGSDGDPPSPARGHGRWPFTWPRRRPAC